MINYKLIHESIEHYEEMGYKRVETPWVVSTPILDLTRPALSKAHYLFNEPTQKGVVASGEQSFLYLYAKNQLPEGAFQTVTPCFRFDTVDSLHTRFFIKNELIETESVSRGNLIGMLNQAKAFFEKFLKTVSIVETGVDQYDLTYQNIELGSYGIRRCEFLEWIYGTGCAEPRLSRAINFSK